MSGPMKAGMNPLHWGELKADYAICKTGNNQSAIDITGTVKADLPPI
jgi:carbonic anhydrase